jgi:hypothetical protein
MEQKPSFLLKLIAMLPLLALCACRSFPIEEPAWLNKAKEISVGMTRTEAESLLPADAKIDMSFGSSGNHRNFYSVGENWRVTLIYRAPMETNLYYTVTSPTGEKTTHGPHNGWAYRPTPDQKVIAGPFVSHVKSRSARFDDPNGSFQITGPVPKHESVPKDSLH